MPLFAVIVVKGRSVVSILASSAVHVRTFTAAKEEPIAADIIVTAIASFDIKAAADIAILNTMGLQ
jgi:hypothetical protein